MQENKFSFVYKKMANQLRFAIFKACSHKMNVRIFEHNFGEYKAKK